MLLASAAEGGTMFLGEDLVGWRTALIAAVVAAVAYELIMAATRQITLRLPFLILYLARIGIPRTEWKRLHGEWVAELHFILGDRDTSWAGRLFSGLRFAVPLVLGGARHTAKASAEESPRRRLTLQHQEINPLMRLAGGGAALALTAVVTSLPLSTPARGLLLLGIGGLAGLLGLASLHVAARIRTRRHTHSNPDHET